MPLGVLEALACSRPCLVTKETNIGRQVMDYHAGFVVRPDPREIAEKIIEAFSSDVNLNVMGDNARKMIEQEFVWSKIADRFCLTYERLLHAS